MNRAGYEFNKRTCIQCNKVRDSRYFFRPYQSWKHEVCVHCASLMIANDGDSEYSVYNQTYVEINLPYTDYKSYMRSENR